MKKLVFLLIVVICFTGCSSYNATEFRFDPTGELVVLSEDGETLSGSDLIGKYCRVGLHDGTVLEGEIREVTPKGISLTRDTSVSALEGSREHATGIAREDISTLTLKWPEKKKSAGLGILAVPFLAVALVLVFGPLDVYQ